jgi:hypothetical protein
VAVATRRGKNAGKDLDTLLDGSDRIDVELPLCYRLDDLIAQHQVVHIFGGNQHALGAGGPSAANVVEALDLLIHAADRLDVSLLVHRAGHGEFLANRQTSDSADSSA